MGVGWVINRIKQVVAIRPPPVHITEWVVIPSQVAALDDGDAMGDAFRIPVPVSGVLQSAHLLGRADQGTQVDVVLLSAPFTPTAGDAQFALDDLEARAIITRLQFTVFNDNADNQDSSLENIGKVYRVHPASRGAKWGWMYGQGIAYGTPTYAAGSAPLLRLEILPDE